MEYTEMNVLFDRQDNPRKATMIVAGKTVEMEVPEGWSQEKFMTWLHAQVEKHYGVSTPKPQRITLDITPGKSNA